VDRITQASSSKNSILSWGRVSPKQKRLVEAILNYPGHIIVTMRSKTEWVIDMGENGKTAPEKLGLAPEQGKGIEYESDLLLELKQNHYAVISKDRTGKYQDVTIEKPGEEFGVAFYDWFSSGKPVIPAAQAEKNASKPKKQEAVPEKPKTEKPGKEPSLKTQSDEVINQIGAIIKTAKNNVQFFTENEEARQITKGTRLDEKGLSDLKDFKTFLSDELAKREAKKAA
jgi:hypothetical protein